MAVDSERGAALTVRPVARNDAAQVAELSGALGYPVAAEVVAQRLARLLPRAEELVLVAETSPGRVVGWIHGAMQELLEAGPRCEILGLVVDARYRGQGIGRRLVAEVEAWAGRQGLDLMTVRSNVVRAESHPFYERLGYRRAKTQHAYRKPLPPPGGP